MALKTDFVKVAQSGPTIDGREIKPEWLLQAANTYDKSFYTAMVFPEHNFSSDNYGTVEGLKAEKNKDGVVSLFAELLPNALWILDNQKKQKLYSSVSLVPLKKSGEMYMYSLGATDYPASLGVEKLQFSKKMLKANHSLFDLEKIELCSSLESQFKKDDPIEDEETVSLFRKIFQFSKQGDEMSQADKDELKALQAQFTQLETEYKTLSAKVSGDGDKSSPTAEQFASLQTENAELKAKVGALEKQSADFSKVQTDLDALKIEFAKALKEEIPGTDSKSGNPVADDKLKLSYAAV